MKDVRNGKMTLIQMMTALMFSTLFLIWKKDIEKYEEEHKIFRSKGFDNFEEPRQIVGDDQILINISVIPLL